MPDTRAFITDEALWSFADFAVHHVDTVRAKDMPFMRHVLAGFMEAYPVEGDDA
jgi:hypothetical protein